MKDPERFIERGAGALEAELVGSMRDDVPSAAAKARALAAFGLGAAATAASSATAAAVSGKAAASSVVSLAAKWLIVGAGTTVLAVGVAHRAGWSFDGAAHRTPAPAALPAPKQAAPASVVAKHDDTESAPSSGETAASDGQVTAPSSRSAAGVRVRSARAPSAPDVELAEEVRALDQARQAALSHDSARALRLVTAYQAKFPKGKLGPEATVLAIEALIASGQKGAAAHLARTFLQRDPSGPLAERVRTLLRGATSP